jgi:hypothetical protein
LAGVIREALLPSCCRGMLAGRRFMMPGPDGLGDFEGVCLLEGTGPEGEKLLESAAHQFPSHGFDVRRSEGTWNNPLYCARIDREKVLFATHRELIIETLQQQGVGARALAIEMGCEHVPWSSPLVLLRKPDPRIPGASDDEARSALWLIADWKQGRRGPSPRLRIRSLLLYAARPADMEFEGRAVLVHSEDLGRLPSEVLLWEMLGGFGFERMSARVDGGEIRLHGELRYLREEPKLACILVFMMLGVRVFI